MNSRILGLTVAASLAASCDTAQPPIGCPVQSLEWAATYKPQGQSNCPLKAGEQIGVQKFTTTPPPGESFGVEYLSLKPTALAALDARDSGRLSYSLGTLPKGSDPEGFCTVTDMAVAEKHAPAGPGLESKDIIYRWSNVRVLALPEAPGSQLVADLEYTEDGCTARYEVWAMWPGDVDCADEAGKPDDTLCVEAGSINPDFAVTCDPTQLRCVPAKRPPSLK